MTITENHSGFEIAFPFDRNKVEEVRNIPGACFLGAKKVWWVPKFRERDVAALRSKYCVDEEGQIVASLPESFDAIPEMPELDVPLDLPRTLFPYQAKGVAYNRLHKRTIIGDQPGLGKTTQLIASIVSLNAFPCLIICPASLKLNWEKEWKDVAGRKAMVLTDGTRNTWHQYWRTGMCDVFIVNYESLKKFFVAPGWTKPKDGTFRANQIPYRETVQLFKSVAIDESHKCKDGQTLQTKFVIGIAKGKEYVFELTGTPVVNKPKDLIPQLVIINRLKDIVSHIPDHSGKDASGYKRFIARYCGGGTGQGSTNTKELNYLLNKYCFYRREKTEVLKDLPAKMRQVVLCEIANRPEYQKAQNDFVAYLKNVKGCDDAEVMRKLKGEVMVKMGILKQISARGKMEAAREQIDEIIEGGEKVVVFCSLREIGDELKRLYPAAVMIRGGMTPEDKDTSVQKFQKDPKTQVIICSIKAAGVGLTLTASSNVLFIEFPWTDADCEQCEDRTHRIGQQSSVTAKYLLGQNTIDQYCYELILKKRSIARAVTGAQDEVQEEIVDELLNLFNQK